MAEDAELLPAYLLLGDDDVKRERVVAKLKARLEPTGMADFNVDERDLSRADEEPGDLVASLNTLPMGTPFRLVVLRGCDRLAKAVSDLLADYLKDPSPSTVCVLSAEKINRSTRLYKAVKKLGAKAVVDCAAPDKTWKWPGFVLKRARARGLAMDQAAAEELASRAGESVRQVDAALERLARDGEAEVTRDDVRRKVARVADPKPWDLSDAVGERDAAQALAVFRRLPEGSYIPAAAMCVRTFRAMAYLKAPSGRSYQQYAEPLGMGSYQAKKYAGFARGFSAEEIEDALRGLLRLDLALRGSSDSAAVFAAWIGRTCGTGRAPRARR